MLIEDNGRSYNTEEMLIIASKKDRDSIERDIYSSFKRLAYLRYTQVRDVVNDNRCHKLKPSDVKERLDVEKVQKYFDYSREEIFFYIQFATDYLRIVQ
ncbi:hypothetical protein ACSSIR_001377 [Enterococcus faecalis]|nr:hypothetical protein [Enterococcus faecalis]EGO8260413.1 hypothetical protein [Enterococcus faecalis]EIX2479461.1 hypothetical protein [Enterococcus faecalis]EJY7260725.1 hypothetical protein [Enterococcus faecalis]EJZ9058256.1 hypothetical protein [Enterococcus faecalis]